jgi:large subunit ribosomal protein L34
LIRTETGLIKRTFQPKKRYRRKTHGFRIRMSSPGGQQVLKARRQKGRKRLTPAKGR